jgi:phosphatidylglycerophosphate synthase
MSSISVGRTGMYTAADRVLRNIPNAISLARLLATPVLLWMVLSHRQELFKWLLLACLLSDILDGWIARAFDVRSKRGTSLDSLADLLVALNMVLGLFVFQRGFWRSTTGRSCWSWGFLQLRP